MLFVPRPPEDDNAPLIMIGPGTGIAPFRAFLEEREARGENWLFFDWLERGAHVYVRGDATRMARDVDAAIHAIIAEHGRLDQAGAAQYVKKLADERRYQRDVYLVFVR